MHWLPEKKEEYRILSIEMSHKGEKTTSCQDCFERGTCLREYLPPNSLSLWSKSTY